MTAATKKNQKQTKAKKTKNKSKKQEQQVHVGFLLDESGSMHPNKESVIAGYNDFVEKLEAPKDTQVTLATFDQNNFDDSSTKIIRFPRKKIKLKDHKQLLAADYNPRGATPLYDAVVLMINDMKKHVNKDDKVMLVIMTDGYENASSEGAEQEAKRLIEECEKADWGFIYLGANQDAWSASQGLGLNQHGKNFKTSGSQKGMRDQMRSASSFSSLYIGSGSKADYDKATRDFSLSNNASLEDREVSFDELKKYQNQD